MNRFSSCLWVCAILTWGFNPDASGTVTYTVLAKIGSSPDGYSPNPVVLGTDGNFYGTTQEGGTSNDGTIFQLTPSGTLTTLYSFTGGSDGYGPISPLVEGSDGNFYGTTSEGAADSNGTFFRITTGGTFTTLHTFNGNTEGSSPDQLIKGSDGNFYGTSGGGGGAAGEGGTVVQITMAGAVKVLHAFATATDGGAVNPSLVQGTDGAFYGSTETGGSSGFGTLFRVTSSDAFSVIGNLTSGSDAPMLTTLGEDGFIYGVNMIPQTIFKMTNAGARTTVYTFTRGNDGGNPYTFILGSDGNFYGTAASYGVNGYGTFFQVTSGGTFHELHAFSSSTGSIYGLVQGPGGTIVATSINGGTGAAGAVTEFTTAGVPTTLYNFVAGGSYPVAALLQASDGNFYGTTQSGGTTNDGTLFGISPTGTSVASISFTAASSGSEPNSQLIQDPSTGDLYGSTATGGANDGGTVFGVHAASSSGDGIKTPDFALAYTLFITTASDFGALPAQVQFAVLLAAGVSGSHPGEAKKDFVRASGGASSLPMFYNMCATGAANGKGSFCSYSSDGTQTDLYDLGNQPTDGSGPESPLVTNGGGIAYGTTGFGGANSQGTVFKVTVNSDGSFNSFTTIHAFAGADGSSPGSNNLVLGTDGLIYGTTRSGGANNGGVVFSMTPSGTIKVLHSFLAPGSTGNDGSEPYAGLIQASDGNFYGTTLGGGSNGVGTIYSITPSGTAPSKLTVLHSFDGTDGFQPQAALIQANDGNLYGVTSGGGGGLAGAGVVFKLAAGLPIPKGTTAQTITFGALANQTVGAAPITLGATASSGLAVTYAVTGPATISGSTLTITGVGTVKVTASQAGNSTYAAATPVSQSFTVSKGTQTITFPVIADQSYGEPAFTLPNPPTASSGLAVTIKVLSGPAKITGDTLTFSGVGAVTLAANQAGNASYSAAAQVTTSFNVVKGSQTIAPFAPIATQYKGEPAFAITPPVATSKLPVTVTVQSGNATISGNKVTVTGPGTVVLAANQPGNADYNAAPTVTTSFTVDETKQTISAFATIPTKTYGVAPFTITIPKASSGLPVTVTVLTDNATISGDTVTITGDGTVTLAANQAGNASFAPAAQVTTSFMVNGLPQTISAFPTIKRQDVWSGALHDHAADREFRIARDRYGQGRQSGHDFRRHHHVDRCGHGDVGSKPGR